ncbi:MAG: hypothetical protein KF784_09205 [Fimbriimonadaceae bacterium]|nr:hypothetical protein [Fimbriimonadaceae bacterium]
MKLIRQALLLTCLTIGAIFSSDAVASDFNTAIAGRVFCDANCNKKIDVDEDDLLMKVKVQLYNSSGQLLATTTPEIYGGTYIFPNLTPGQKYFVRVVVPYGSEAVKAYPSPASVGVDKRTISVIVVNSGETYYPNDFLLKCCTVGFNQCEWGYDRCGFSPIDLVRGSFDELFPNGLTIGGDKTLTFTSYRAVLKFLPSTGTPKALPSSKVDPNDRYENDLAGNVLALALNVAASDAGLTIEGYGDRVMPMGKFQGYTVREVLAIANQVLGGNSGVLPAGVSIKDLNRTLESINDFSSCYGGCGGRSNNCGGRGWKGCGGSGGWGHGSGGGNGCGGGYGGGWW